jgi:hypothetical protein
MKTDKTSIETESLPSTPDGFEGVQYPVPADIKMPSGVVPMHIKIVGAEKTLCGDIHPISGHSLGVSEFEDYDYGPVDWMQGREDICDECVTKFAATLATTPEQMPRAAVDDLIAAVDEKAAHLRKHGWDEHAALTVARQNVLDAMEVYSDLPWDIDRTLVKTALNDALGFVGTGFEAAAVADDDRRVGE